MKSKKIAVTIEASSTGYGVFTDALPGITGYGKTVAEAKSDFECAFDEVVEAYRSNNENLPQEFNNGKLVFDF